MYVCRYICLSQITSVAEGREFKMVPYDSPMYVGTLLRHKIIGMRCLTNAWHVILAPIGGYLDALLT